MEKNVRLYVCTTPERTLPNGLETSGQKVYRLYWHTFTLFFFKKIVSMIFCVFQFFRVFESCLLWTCLL